MFGKQIRIYSLALLAALACSASAYCQSPFLSHENGSNTTSIGIGPNSSILLFATANLPAVDSLDLSVGVLASDVGGNNILNPAPVQSISGLGIFSGATTVFTPASQGGDANALLSIPNSTTLTGNPLVAEIFFDTTGLSDGDTFAYGVTGDFLNGNERFETINVLTFFATATAVPEPSSAGVLLALGTIVMMRRKRD